MARAARSAMTLVLAVLISWHGLSVAQASPLTPNQPVVTNPGTGTSLNITWSAPADPTRAGFNLYRATTDRGPFEKTNPSLLTQLEFTDSNLIRNATYWYRVTAVDSAGTESEPSILGSGAAKDTAAPAAPTVSSAAGTGISGQINVSWQDNSEVDLDGYNVYFGIDLGQPLERGNTSLISGTSWLQTGLIDGQNYYFRVTAVDTSGNESSPSSDLTASPTDLSPPKVVNTRPADRQKGTGTAEPVRVRFDDRMDPATLTASSLRLLDSAYQAVGGTSIAYDSGSHTATINHSTLGMSSLYWVYVTPDAKNQWGAALNPEYNFSFTTGTSVYNRPHFDFLASTDYCALCHSAHQANGKALLSKANETAVCLFCHDGSQSEFNIKSSFSVTSTVYHPVTDTEAAPSGSLRCSSCHNPHGDKQPDGTAYPKLLRSSDGTNQYYSGNSFCLACHAGKTNSSAVHYDTGFAPLRPSSGTMVTCSTCHTPHGGTIPYLAKAAEENLCYQCHNDAANSRSGRNIQEEFNISGGSRHDITGSTGAKIECSSCHGPHTVARDDFDSGAAVSELSDPDNTRRFFAQGSGSNTTTGNLTGFCLICHDGAPPSFVKNSSTMVPFTIAFPAWNFTNASGGWSKNSYPVSGHYSGGQLQCDWCHGSHGTAYPRLTTAAEDTSSVNGICLRCHAGSYPAGVNPSRAAAEVNVRGDLVKTYRHPALDTSGKHSDTESLNNAPLSNRHAECVDCHDPHSATAATAAAPDASGALKNVTGAGFNSYDSTTRPAWTSLAFDSPVYKFLAAVQYQYELCYKCHSSWSFGTTPPSGGTDLAKEFNPNNPSHHAVEAPGKNPYRHSNGNSYASSLINGYTPSSRLNCTDCHGSDSTSVKGVHGSSNPQILRKPYNSNTGKGGLNTSSHLCFTCHDYNVYRGSASGTATGFSNGTENLHAMSDHKMAACMDCHGQTPHGVPRTHLIVLKTDGAPLAYSNAKLTKYIDKVNTSNQYQTSNCSAGHTSAHP